MIWVGKGIFGAASDFTMFKRRERCGVWIQRAKSYVYICGYLAVSESE